MTTELERLRKENESLKKRLRKIEKPVQKPTKAEINKLDDFYQQFEEIAYDENFKINYHNCIHNQDSLSFQLGFNSSNIFNSFITRDNLCFADYICISKIEYHGTNKMLQLVFEAIGEECCEHYFDVLI